MGQDQVLVAVEHPDAVPEYVDGQLDDEVLALTGRGQEDVVSHFLGLLHQFVLLGREAVQVLLQQVGVPVGRPADEAVLELDGQLVLDLDVADGAAALELELAGAHHELAVLGHVQQLQLLVVEGDVAVLDVDLLLLADELAVAHVPVGDVVEEQLVPLLQEDPVN